MSKALTTRQARRAIASDDDAKREAVMNELEALAASEITDVIRCAPDGTVVVTGSDQLSSRARKAIKKVKVTPTQHGNAIEQAGIHAVGEIPARREEGEHHTGCEQDDPFN